MREEDGGADMEEDRHSLPNTVTGEPTVNASRFIAVVRTVVDLVTLLGAVYAGTITALEFIRATRQQSCNRQEIEILNLILMTSRGA